MAAHRLGPLALALGLTLSFTLAGLFIATIGFAIGLDNYWFRAVAAVVLILFGVLFLRVKAQERFASASSSLSAAGNSALMRFRIDGLA